MQSIFGRAFQRFPIFIKEGAKHHECRYFCKRIDECSAKTWYYIQIATSGFYERKQTRPIYPFTASQDGIQIGSIVYHKIQSF